MDWFFDMQKELNYTEKDTLDYNWILTEGHKIAVLVDDLVSFATRSNMFDHDLEKQSEIELNDFKENRESIMAEIEQKYDDFMKYKETEEYEREQIQIERDEAVEEMEQAKEEMLNMKQESDKTITELSSENEKLKSRLRENKSSCAQLLEKLQSSSLNQ